MKTLKNKAQKVWGVLNTPVGELFNDGLVALVRAYDPNFDNIKAGVSYRVSDDRVSALMNEGLTDDDFREYDAQRAAAIKTVNSNPLVIDREHFDSNFQTEAGNREDYTPAFAGAVMALGGLAAAVTGGIVLHPSIGDAATLDAQSQQIDLVRVDRIVKGLKQNEIGLFHSAIDVRNGKDDHSVQVCLVPPAEVASDENYRKPHSSQFVDFFNSVGMYNHPDSKILSTIRMTLDNYFRTNRPVEYAKFNFNPETDVKILRTSDEKSEFADFFSNRSIPGITRNMGSPMGPRHDFWEPGKCFEQGPDAIQFYDEARVVGTPAVPVPSQEGGAHQTTPPAQSDPNQQTPPAPNQQTPPAPNQQTPPAPNQQTPPAPNQQTPPAPSTQTVPKTPLLADTVLNNGRDLQTGKQTSRLAFFGGVDYEKLSERVTSEILDANGVPLRETQNRGMQYPGGHIGGSVRVVDWLDFVAYVNGMSGDGNSEKSTHLRYAAGPSVLFSPNGKPLARLNVLYAGANGNLKLDDQELSVKQDWNLAGADISVVTENLLRKGASGLWLYAGGQALTGKLDNNTTIRLAQMGIPDVTQDTSENYGITTFYGGAEALFGKGKFMLGGNVAVRNSNIRQGEGDQGVNATFVEFGPEMLLGLNKNWAMKLSGVYGMGFVDVKDPSIIKDEQSYFGVKFDLINGVYRPRPTGFDSGLIR